MQTKAEILSLSSTFFYSLALSMSNILIPLYAFHLDYNPFHIGLLISTPGIVQLVVRFFGGSISDRVGEKRVILFGFGSMIAGLYMFTFRAIAVLFIAQLILGASRAIYWTTSQAYASKIDESRLGSIMGRMSGLTNAGQVLGLFIGGVFAGAFGYTKSFGISIAVTALAFLLGMALPELSGRKPPEPKGDRKISGMTALFKERFLHLAGIMAFIAAINSSVHVSFYPMFFREIGFAEASVGMLNAVRPIGSIVIGFLFAYCLKKLGEKGVFAAGVGGMGLLTLVSPFFHSGWSLTLLMFAMGLSAGCTQVLYQVIATKNSPSDKRGSYLSFVGVYWGVGILVMPSLFGLLVTFMGIAHAFMTLGGLMALIAVFTPFIYQILAPLKPSPAEEKKPGAVV